MADVFISYSRKDKAFVEQLAAALTDRGKDVWVDWEDIPFSAEWEQEIFGGIDAADAFVFVITPDSLASDICGREVARAAEQRKRIVPLVLREPNGLRVPGALAERNWIFFRPGDEFDPAFAALVETLETDLDWVRAHTRLLVRAREWKALGDTSLLLRGNDLREAEQRLASVGSEQEPQPTSEQREYVLASRRGATRRGRIIMGAVVVALAATALLGVLALLQRNEAQDQRDEAVRQARIARSRELAARANAQLASDPEESVVLARRALWEARTPEAVSALRTALSGAHVTALMTGHEAWVVHAELSRDGKLLATASDDGTARLWDAESGSPLAVLSHRAPVRSADVSPDGRTVVTAADDGTIRIWDVTTGDAIRVIRATRRVVRADLDRSGTRVATAGTGRPSAVWDVASGRRIATLRGEGRTPNRLRYTPDGRRLVTAADDGTVRVWDPRSGRPLHVLRADPGGAGRSVLALTVSRDSRLVAAGGSAGAVRVWRVGSGELVRRIDAGAGLIAGIAFSPTGDRIGIAAEGGAAIWDLDTGVAATVLRGHTGVVTTIAFDPRGERVVTASGDGPARLWDAQTGDVIAELRGHDGWVSGAAFSERGDRVETYGQDGTARVWAADVGGPRHVLVEGADPVLALAFSADGRSVAGTGLTPTGIWATDTGADRMRAFYYGSDVESAPDGSHAFLAAGLFGAVKLEAGNGDPTPLLANRGAVMKLDLSSDGRLLAAGTANGRVFVVPAKGGAAVELGRHETVVGELVFDRAGERVLTAADDGIARVSDAATGRELAVLRHPGRVADAVFSRDGRLVATASGRLPRIWNAASGELLTTLRGHSNVVYAVDLDATGERLVSASADSTARVWDRRSGRTLLVLRGHTGVVAIARFDPTGRHVLTGAWDGTARVWDARSGEPLAVFRAPEQIVYDARFAPDGQQVGVATIDLGAAGVGDLGAAIARAERGDAAVAGALRLYDCVLCGSTDELLRIADRRLARRLSVGARDEAP